MPPARRALCLSGALLTFFLAFPAYLLLPWVRRMLVSVDNPAPARA